MDNYIQGLLCQIIDTTNLRIDKLKRQAHKLAKDQSLPKHEALNKIAESVGFDSWLCCKKTIEANRLEEEAISRKAFAHELPKNATLTDQIVGVRKSSKGKIKVRIKESTLNLTGQTFISATAFRNELEHNIKNVIFSSKDSFVIALHVYINQNTANLLINASDFFYSIQDRYIRIHTMHVEVVEPEIVNAQLLSKLPSFEEDNL